jgi:hypothetical protein
MLSFQVGFKQNLPELIAQLEEKYRRLEEDQAKAAQGCPTT